MPLVNNSEFDFGTSSIMNQCAREMSDTLASKTKYIQQTHISSITYYLRVLTFLWSA